MPLTPVQIERAFEFGIGARPRAEQARLWDRLKRGTYDTRPRIVPGRDEPVVDVFVDDDLVVTVLPDGSWELPGG